MNDQGFGLIEVLVAGAVFTVIMLGVMGLTNFTNRVAVSSEATNDFSSLTSSMNSLFENTDNCTQAMKGVLPGGVSNPVFSPTSPPSLGGMPPVLSGVPGNVGNIKITSLAFTSANAVGTTHTQYFATLHLVAQKVVGAGGHEAVGGQSLQHDFQLLMTVDPTTGNAAAGYKFLNCSGFADSLWMRAANNVDIYYNSGNVGIGTTAPINTLDVNGDFGIIGPSLNAGFKVATTGLPSATVGNKLWVIRGNSDTSPYNPGLGGALTFERWNGTSPSVSMAMTASGNVGIGTTSPGLNLDIMGSTTTLDGWRAMNTSLQGITGYWNNSISAGKLNAFNWSNHTFQPLYIDGTPIVLNGSSPGGGNVTIGSSTNHANLMVYGTSNSLSDRRLKRDIQPLPDELDNVLKLQGVSYYWKTDGPASGRRQIGLIAQDVEKVFPELVETDRNGLKSLNYAQLISPVIEAIKGIYAKFETRNASVDKRLDALEFQNAQLRKENERIQHRLEGLEKLIEKRGP